LKPVSGDERYLLEKHENELPTKRTSLDTYLAYTSDKVETMKDIQSGTHLLP